MTAQRFPLQSVAGNPEDRRYFLRRAEDELERAQAAGHPEVVRSHYVMAERYLDRVYGSQHQGSED
ncbi:hypothetical protein E2493_17095 [Sphingomonas parva]|uniref:DUF4167 domain-containing protein n=1 Tax=Sphingomonas parva TaxID=2555898 RepID=A0A4Y8ZQG9_9SPHN|nr:hypothetical protein [Sphingomonas parva]TFI57069.1 hypothetical protein E2493_17095 [Sphingomonas parva]